MKPVWTLGLGLAAGIAITGLAMGLSGRRPGPNVILNGGFEEGLAQWGWYVHQNQGAQAEFTAEYTRGADKHAAKISVSQAGLYDSVELSQGPITVRAGSRYQLTFRARSTVRQPIRAQIIQNAPPWTFCGFRVSTEITPEWREYRLSGRASVSGKDTRLLFQCGGAVGQVWIDEVELREERS